MTFTLRPTCGQDFVGREELINEMILTLSSKDIQMGFALYGRRRIGKSSIFLELARKLQKKRGIVPVYFSLWNLVEFTVEEFVQEFSSAILEAYKHKISLKTKAKEAFGLPLKFLQSMLETLKVSIALREEISIILTLKKEKRSINELISSVFNLAENLAKETNTRCVLFIDEFPSFVELKGETGENLVKKIRTICETQHHTVLNITGSVRKTLELVALAPTSAFYKQFIMKKVSGLERKEVKMLLEKNLKVKLSDEIVKEVYNFTHGIPFYIHFIGRQIKQSSCLDLETVKNGIAQFLNEEGDLFFKEEFNRLSPKEQTIVVAMIRHNLNNLSEIAKVLNEPTGTISQFLSYLEEKGVVIKLERGIYQLDDPVFQYWVDKKVSAE